ncbi:MAG: HNH endonuclease [Candidatus Zixiibacteriota bacterium]|nr:MAG: HNH endonuclease [candidate division Zixibacteria bacterium]
MKFELDLKRKSIPDSELLADLKRISGAGSVNTVTMAVYKRCGRFSCSTIAKRFGSWPKALEAASLEISPHARKWISDEALFENLREIWTSLARQPRYNEMRAPLSRYTASPYERRFGTWNESLKAFITWVDEDQEDSWETVAKADGAEADTPKPRDKRRTKREISPRLRFSILLRDGFRCQSCGKSPIKTPGVELHVDHLVPWSEGGETVADNLQVKCQTCNLGKGNVFDK